MKRMFINLLVIIAGNSITYSMEPDIPINEIDEAIRSKNIISVNEFIPNVDLNIEKISDNAIFDVLGEHPENEELIKIAFRVAFRAIQREHNMQVQIAGIQVQNIFDRCMREKENEINALKERYNNIEKKYILRGLLLRINITDKTLIQYRATDIEQMSIFERHKVVNEIYEKVLPFAELFGRDDLDVVATKEDFSNTEAYIKNTRINMQEPKIPRPKPILIGHDLGWGNRGGPVEWNNGRRGGADHGAWVNPILIDWFNEMGIYGYDHWWWNKYVPNKGSRKFDSAWNRADIEYSRRLAIYNKQKTEYDIQVRHAESEKFPSESFNRLIDQVNSFLSEGL